MKNRIVCSVVLILALAVAAAAQQRGGARILGTVLDRQGRTVPGLKIALVDRQGRGGSNTTDQYGRFYFSNVPPGQNYLLMVYWGRELMYRQEIRVDRDINLGPIRL